MKHTSVEDHIIKAHVGHIVMELHDGREDTTVIVPDGATTRAKPFGVVVDVGDEVEGVSIGDKLIFMPSAMLIGIEHRERKLVFVKKEMILGKYVREIRPIVTISAADALGTTAA